MSRMPRLYAGLKAEHQLLQIASFHRPLCQQHSLQQANQFPLNACRCFDHINDKWRCKECCDDAMACLETRCFLRNSALNLRLPVSWCRSNFRFFRDIWYEIWQVNRWCPISGCQNMSWYDETSMERMGQCMACNVITRR